jgi:hypothetical protein
MPLAAGFGVGAVVSALNHYLKPRELAQRTFGNDYQLGRTLDFVVESILPSADGAAPRCAVQSPSHVHPTDGSSVHFSVACASVKLVTAAPVANRIPVRTRLHVFDFF